MASTRTDPPFTVARGNLESFHEAIGSAKRVLALCGAGLSASSGLPTFRGAGGLWRTHDSISLATPEAFERDPGLVWQFYNYRRHMALSVNPNPAHYALSELARKMPGFQCLSQNVDGLLQRSQHPSEQLQLLHGTLFELHCADKYGCGYTKVDFTDPVCPALKIPTSGVDPTSNEARKEVSEQLQAKQKGHDLDISDANVPLPHLKSEDLPQCPQCKKNMLRPGVVWFGEALPDDVLDKVHDYMDEEYSKIDLIMVIGTSAQVYPAAGYVPQARYKGARVAIINADPRDEPAGGWENGDWSFVGDAALIMPELLKPIIGEVKIPTKA